MFLCSAIPYSSPDNKNQTSPSPMTEAELYKEIQPPTYTWYQRLFQILCFVIFLGPLRILLILFATLLISSTILSLVVLGFDPKRVPGAWSVIRFGMRLFVLSLGVGWISTDGRLSHKTRIIVSNHIGFLDVLVFIAKWDISIVCKAEMSRVPIISTMLTACLTPVYVERSKSSGAAQQIVAHAEGRGWPLLIFPEGTIGGGRIVLKFHTGAFVPKTQFQTVTIRMITPLLPTRWNTYVWTGQSVLNIIWSMLSMPWSIVRIDWGDVQQGGKDVAEMADKAQIAMANKLGITAVDARSDCLVKRRFRPPSD